jgi:2-dehydro-3-deoxyglucarate aldolase/4-hydroxy-2-oxoheptanedioate aldolase
MGKIMKSNFRSGLKNGDLMIGTMITMPLPEVTEIMIEVGFDWLFVDTEHAPFNARDALKILQTAGNRCPCVVRIPANDEVWIKKALDIGADGIIAPQVHSAEEAEQIVKRCKYPPGGARSIGIGRAHKYGLGFKQYVEKANDEVAVILQAENTQALKNISEIVQVQGIDAIFIGPYDLSASMGKMGDLADVEVRQAIATIAKCCQNADLRLGIFVDTAETAATYIQQGFTLIAISTDGLYMALGAKETLSSLKP